MDPFTVATPQLDELIAKLTPRQLEIVELLARGCTRRQIAALLSISPETVKTHTDKIYRKLEAENRIQVVVMFTMWRAKTM